MVISTDRLSPVPEAWVLTGREETAHHLRRKPASHLVSPSFRFMEVAVPGFSSGLL